MSLRIIFLAFLVFSSCCVSAATNLRENTFSINYLSDVDRFEFVSHKKMLIVASELATPVIYTDSGSFQVDYKDNGKAAIYNSTLLNPVNAVSNVLDQDVAIGDFNGDGVADYIARSCRQPPLFITSCYEHFVLVFGTNYKNSPDSVFMYDLEIGKNKNFEVRNFDGSGSDELVVKDTEGYITDIYSFSTINGASGEVTSATPNKRDSSLYESYNRKLFQERRLGAGAIVQNYDPTMITPVVVDVEKRTGALSAYVQIDLPEVGYATTPVSLSYSSKSGSATWNINIGSEISRCDRVSDKVDGSFVTNWCLDAKELIPLDSAGNYIRKNKRDSLTESIQINSENASIRKGDGTTYLYSTEGAVAKFGEAVYLLRRITRPAGQSEIYSYDDDGRLDKVEYIDFNVDIEYLDLDTDDNWGVVPGAGQIHYMGRDVHSITVTDKSSITLSRYQMSYANTTMPELEMIQYCSYGAGDKDEACAAPAELSYEVGVQKNAVETTLSMSAEDFRAASVLSDDGISLARVSEFKAGSYSVKLQSFDNLENDPILGRYAGKNSSCGVEVPKLDATKKVSSIEASSSSKQHGYGDVLASLSRNETHMGWTVADGSPLLRPIQRLDINSSDQVKSALDTYLRSQEGARSLYPAGSPPQTAVCGVSVNVDLAINGVKSSSYVASDNYIRSFSPYFYEPGYEFQYVAAASGIAAGQSGNVIYRNDNVAFSLAEIPMDIEGDGDDEVLLIFLECDGSCEESDNEFKLVSKVYDPSNIVNPLSPSVKSVSTYHQDRFFKINAGSSYTPDEIWVSGVLRDQTLGNNPYVLVRIGKSINKIRIGDTVIEESTVLVGTGKRIPGRSKADYWSYYSSKDGITGDFNGDGITDSYYDGQLRIFNSFDASFGSVPDTSMVIEGGSSIVFDRGEDVTQPNVSVVDLNGDGRSDMIFYTESGAEVYLSSIFGMRYSEELTDALAIPVKDARDIKIGDFDDDSDIDFIYRKSDGKVVHIEMSPFVMNLTSVSSNGHSLYEIDYADEYQGLYTLTSADNEIGFPYSKSFVWRNNVESITRNLGMFGLQREVYAYEGVEKSFDSSSTFVRQISTTVFRAESTADDFVKLSEKAQINSLDGIVTLTQTDFYVSSIDAVGSQCQYKPIDRTYDESITTVNGFRYRLGNLKSDKSYSATQKGTSSCGAVLTKSVEYFYDGNNRLRKSVSSRDGLFDIAINSYVADSRDSLDSIVRIVSDDAESEICTTESCASQKVTYGYGSSSVYLPETVQTFDGDVQLTKLKYTFTGVYSLYHSGYIRPYTFTSTDYYQGLASGSSVETYVSYTNGYPTSVNQYDAGNTSMVITSGTARNARGDVTQTSQAGGITETFTYDAFGRVETASSNIGQIHSTDYASCQSEVCPAGAYSVVKYFESTDELSRTYFDVVGNKIASSVLQPDGEGYLYSYNDYDLRGRVTHTYTGMSSLQYTADVANTALTYYPSGQIRSTSEKSDGSDVKTTNYSYGYGTSPDAVAGVRLVYTTQTILANTSLDESNTGQRISKLLTSPESGRVYKRCNTSANGSVFTDTWGCLSYTYDLWGNPDLVTSKFGTETTTFNRDYDSSGNLLKSERPGRGAWQYTYTGAGLLKTETSPAQTGSVYSYDGLGRLTSKSVPGESMVVLKYDNQFNGLLDSVEVGGVTAESTTYEENVARVKLIERSVAGKSVKQAVTYDADGRIEDTTINDSLTRTYSYSFGMLNGEKQGEAWLWKNESWDGKGRMTARTLFDSALTYNRELELFRGRTLGRSVSTDAGEILGEDLYFDALGQLRVDVSSGENTPWPAEAHFPTYDGRGYLTGVVDTAGEADVTKESFNVNNYSNVTSINGSSVTFITNSTRVEKYQDVSASNILQTLGYDTNNSGYVETVTPASGDAPLAIQYNFYGQPISVNGISINYHYDGSLSSINYGTYTRGYWGDVELLVTPESATPEIRWLRHGIEVVKRSNGQEDRYFIYTDHQKSIRAVLSDDGTVLSGRTYSAYGRIEADYGNDMTAYTSRCYNSHVCIDGTQLVHMGARLYNANSATFTSPDPIFADDSSLAGLSAYGFSYGNPFMYWDPYGTEGIVIEQEQNFREWANDHDIPIEVQGIVFASAVALDDVLLAGISFDNSWETNLTQALLAAIPASRVGGKVVNKIEDAIGDRINLGVTNTAGSAADVALAAGKKSGAAAELRVGDKVFTGVSGEEVAHNPQVTGALMGTPASARKPWHGGCAEIVCLDKALNAGVNPAGGEMKAVNIGVSGKGHGTPKMICLSCSDVLDHFGVNK